MANSTDRVALWVLEAPLLYDKLGPVLGLLHLYHMGLGFHNLDTGDKWQVEFDGMPDFIHAVFPTIVTENGTTNVDWESSGAAILYKGINESYWQSAQWKVAELTGDQHNQYIKGFLASVNTTRAFYDLFDVYDEFPAGTRYISSYTCMDFVWESLGWLKDEASVVLDYSQKLKRDFTIFYASQEPPLVDYDGPHHSDIVTFYEMIQGKFKEMNIVHFILELADLLAGHVYVRQGRTDTYHYVPLHKPYFNFKYAYAPMPGQTFTDAEIQMMKHIDEEEQAQVEKNWQMMKMEYRTRFGNPLEKKL